VIEAVHGIFIVFRVKKFQLNDIDLVEKLHAKVLVMVWGLVTHPIINLFCHFK